MLRNYLKTAWRNLLRHKLFSMINISGLAIGMACCILITLFVRDELSYDRYHEKGERIYRVLGPRTCFPLGAVVRDAVPEVSETVRFTFKWKRLVSYKTKRFEEPAFVYADPNVFQVFSFPLIKGDPRTVLANPLSIVITEEIARKYFDDEDPIGKVLTVENEHDYMVTGILGEVPRHSHFRFDFLATFVGAEEVFWKEFLDHWGMGNFFTYLLLHENSSISEVERKMSEAIVEPMRKRNPELRSHPLRLQSLLDIHLHSADLKGDIEPQGNIAHVYVFSAIAVFILLIACINFMNLSTARSVRRMKEVGMRKVVGAHRWQLIRQFLGESILLATISMVLTLVLVELFLPVFNGLVSKELTLFDGGWTVLPALVGIALCVGFLAGSYPAFFLSAFRPAEILKGKGRTGTGSALFRRALVLLQFSISIVLIVGTGIVYTQMEYLGNKSLGFNQEHVVVVKVPRTEKRETLKAELRQHPNVLHVSSANHVPPDALGHSTIYIPEDREDDTWVRTVLVDYEYFETLGIEFATGRSFSEEFVTDATDALILNESAVELFGLEDPLGTQFVKIGWTQQDGQVIGVVRNFHFESLYERINPLVFLVDLSDCFKLVVRIRPEDIPGTLDFIEEKWSALFPDEIFSYRFVDQSFDEEYRVEERMGQIAGSSALLALFVACLGVFGLASFSAEQRTKEIGIRKVLGASLSSIVTLLSKEVSWLVVGANAIAWPVAYFAMQRWLQHFAYRIDLGPGIFMLGGIIALAIAWLTVSYQAIRSALANPVNALRNE